MDFSDCKGIYVVAIPKYGEMQKVTGELIGASRELAAELNESVSVVLVGSEIRDKAQELIHLGADFVYVMDAPIFTHYDGVAYQKALTGFFKEKKPNIVMFGADPYGRDLAPRMAADLVCGVTADVTELSVEPETKLVVWRWEEILWRILSVLISVRR